MCVAFHCVAFQRTCLFVHLVAVGQCNSQLPELTRLLGSRDEGVVHVIALARSNWTKKRERKGKEKEKESKKTRWMIG